jgi:hypothetical protein
MKLNEKTGLYENYGLWHVPFWQTAKFQLGVKIAGAVIALIIVVFLVRKYVQYCKRKKLPLWDQALLDVSNLKKEHKVDVVHGKEFYVSVCAILKNYFGNRFGYDIAGKTDAEVIDYLQKKHPDEQTVEDMKMVLQGSEIIKFANAQAAQEQIEQDYVRAVAIITKTIPEKK